MNGTVLFEATFYRVVSTAFYCAACKVRGPGVMSESFCNETLATLGRGISGRICRAARMAKFASRKFSVLECFQAIRHLSGDSNHCRSSSCAGCHAASWSHHAGDYASLPVKPWSEASPILAKTATPETPPRLVTAAGEGLPLWTPGIRVVHGTVPRGCARNALPEQSVLLFRRAPGEPQCRRLPTSSKRAPVVRPN